MAGQKKWSFFPRNLNNHKKQHDQEFVWFGNSVFNKMNIRNNLPSHCCGPLFPPAAGYPSWHGWCWRGNYPETTSRSLVVIGMPGDAGDAIDVNRKLADGSDWGTFAVFEEGMKVVGRCMQRWDFCSGQKSIIHVGTPYNIFSKR